MGKETSLHIEAATENRRRFRKRLKKEIVVLEGNSLCTRNDDVDFSFRQESHFLYLSAFNEPDAKIILTADEEYLFIPEVTETHLVWIGEAETTQSAKRKYKFKHVFYLEEYPKVLKKLASKKRKCLAAKKNHSSLRKKYPKFILEDETYEAMLTDARAIKSKKEVEIMAQSGRYSSKAHVELMQKIKPGMYEYQAQNIFEGCLRYFGVSDFAYPSIVAAGKNASVLHYIKNKDKINKGQFLLIDAGGEYLGYASDITRTYPVSGVFTKDQKRVYEIVLRAQKECIKMIKSGIWMTDLQKKSIEMITDGLIRLGILRGELSELIEAKAYFPFYPHGVSHMLGIDVHDVTPKLKGKDKKRGRDFILKEGHVITVEPGLYFIEALLTNSTQKKSLGNMVNWAKAKSLIPLGGVRIEDDILVLKNGSRSLTKVPKEIDEIEKVMAS